MITSLVIAMAMTKVAAGGEPRAVWRSYWLTDEKRAQGYQRLLITQLTFSELTQLKATNTEPPILESSSFWIETHGKDSIWNSDRRPIKLPPPMTNYKEEEQRVQAGEVEYKIELATMSDVIRLLKEPYGTGKIHRVYAPWTGMERTAKALVTLLESESDDRFVMQKARIFSGFEKLMKLEDEIPFTITKRGDRPSWAQPVREGNEILMRKIGDGMLVVEVTPSAAIIQSLRYVVPGVEKGQNTTLDVGCFDPRTGELTVALPVKTNSRQ